MKVPVQVRFEEVQLEQLRSVARRLTDPSSTPSVSNAIRMVVALGLEAFERRGVASLQPPAPPPPEPPEPSWRGETDDQRNERLAREAECRRVRAEMDAQNERELAAAAARPTKPEAPPGCYTFDAEKMLLVAPAAPPPAKLTRAQFDALPPGAKDTIRAQGRAPATTIAERIAAADRALAARPPEPPPPTDPVELVEYNADRMRRGLAPVQ